MNDRNDSPGGSDRENERAQGKGHDNGHGQGPEKFKFSVDNHPFETGQQVLQGSEIKVLAGVNAGFGLFLESHGNQPDQQIADTQTVDLGAPGREQFYTVPPATFGCLP